MAKETTYAETPTYGAGDTFIKWGIHTDFLPAEFPDPVAEWEQHAENNSLEVSYYATIGRVETTGFQFLLVNGMPLFWVLGKSTNTDEGTYFKHVITPRTKGTDLPSFLYHEELQSAGSNWSRHATGCKLGRLDLILRENRPIIAAMAFTGSLVATGTNLTNAPGLVTNSGTSAYKKVKTTLTYAGNAVAVLKSLRLSVINTLDAIHTDRAANTFWAEFVDEGEEIIYLLEYTMEASEHQVFDDVLAQTQRDNTTILIERGTNDEISIDLDGAAPIHDKFPAKKVHGKIISGALLKLENFEATVEDAINNATAYGSVA